MTAIHYHEDTISSTKQCGWQCASPGIVDAGCNDRANSAVTEGRAIKLLKRRPRDTVLATGLGLNPHIALYEQQEQTSLRGPNEL